MEILQRHPTKHTDAEHNSLRPDNKPIPPIRIEPSRDRRRRHFQPQDPRFLPHNCHKKRQIQQS